MCLFEALNNFYYNNSEKRDLVLEQQHESLQTLSQMKQLALSAKQQEITQLYETEVATVSGNFQQIRDRTLQSLQEQSEYLQQQALQFYELKIQTVDGKLNGILQYQIEKEQIEQKLEHLNKIHRTIFVPKQLPQLLFHAKALESTQFAAACQVAIGQNILDEDVYYNCQLNECSLIKEEDFEKILQNASDEAIYQMYMREFG